MTKYYEADSFLRTLIGQRNKHIYDLSALIGDALHTNDSSAIFYNYRNEMDAAIARWKVSIGKRKKQIEICVKAPWLYGKFRLTEPLPLAEDQPEPMYNQAGPALVFIFKEALDEGRHPNFLASDYYFGPYHAMPQDTLHTGQTHNSHAREIVPFFAYGEMDAAGDPGGGQYGGPGDVVPGSDPQDPGDPGDGSVDVGPRRFERISFRTEPLFSFDASSMPINDFSWLADLNFDIEITKQQNLMFKKGDVEGIILPVHAKFVQANPRTVAQQTSHLYVTPIGMGGIIYTTSSNVVVLSLTDSIITDSLFAQYSFLEPGTVTPKDWWKFPTLNSVTPGVQGNASLTSVAATSTFRSGVSIPFLEGICILDPSNRDWGVDPTGRIQALGSYMMLPPENSYNYPPETPSRNDPKDFVDMTYNPHGFSYECWTKVPGLEETWDDGVGTSSLTKALIACENTGVASTTAGYYSDLNLDYMPNARNSDLTRGFITGFTRDRRLSPGGLGHSNVPSENNTISFFVAPTISRDASACSWINSTGNEANPTLNYHCAKVPITTSVNGKSFSRAASEFVHLVVTVDPPNDTLCVYLDGEKMGNFSVADTFGTEPYHAVNLPSFRQENSFQYQPRTEELAEHGGHGAGNEGSNYLSNSTGNGIIGPTELKQGPRLSRFTPYIVGGGYTDGATFLGNFMGGGAIGGRSSGYNGYIGSLKFYKKPLNSTEVLKNYNGQKGFFKTIVT